MTDVFISYSRKDIAFARLLHEALVENELETWIDWQDIPPSADWLAEVYEAIEAADAFVFIISETSLASEVCGLEIAHAAKHNKRLIPIVIHDVEAEQVPKELSVLNWIFFDEAGEKFAEAMDDLVTAITVDQAWVKGHTRFQNRALDWERKERDHGALLRGADLSEAEAWLSSSAGKDPQPTALQTEYILKSREDATRRQRRTLLGVGAALVVAIGLGIFAWTQRNVAVAEGHARATAQAEAVAEAEMRATAQVQAEEQRITAEARLLAGLALDAPTSKQDLALLLSIEGIRKDINFLTISSLFSNLQENYHLLRHFHGQASDSFITEIKFSPTGEIVIAGNDEPVQIWDPISGEFQAESLPDYSKMARFAISPDGENIATVHVSEEINILKMGGSGSFYQKIHIDDEEPHPPSFTCIEYSPDGGFLAAGDMLNGMIYLLDVQKGEVIHRFQMDLDDTGSMVGFIDFSPLGDVVAAGGVYDMPVYVWDVTSGEKLLEIETGHGHVRGVEFTPDGEMLVTAGDDGVLRLWDAETGELLHNFSEEKRGIVWTFTISPKNRYMFSSHEDNSIILWDLEEKAKVGLWATLERYTLYMDVSPDGYYLVTGSEDNVTRLWSVYSTLKANEPFNSDCGHSDNIHSMEFTPDDKYLVSASWDELCLWDLETGEIVGEPYVGHEGDINSLAVHPDGDGFVSGGWDNKLRFWSYDSPTQIKKPLDLGEYIPYALRYTPSGDILAGSFFSTNEDRTEHISKVILWDSATMETIIEIQGELNIITAIEFSPDGTILAIAEAQDYQIFADDVQIRLWDIVNSIQIAEALHGHEDHIVSLDFNSDGRVLVSNDYSGGIRFWDLDTGEQIGDAIEDWTFEGRQEVRFIVPNSNIIAITDGHDYGGIHIIDATTHEAIGKPISGSNARGFSFKFPGDTPLYGYAAQDADITFLAVSHTGSILASGAEDGSIRVWDFDLDHWIEKACQKSGRNLTEEEWFSYLPFDPYRLTCPQYP